MSTSARTRARVDQRGAAVPVVLSVLAFVAALGVGAVVGMQVRSAQNEGPTMDLGAPVERSTTSTSEVPRSTLELPTTVDTTIAPETTVPPETQPPTTSAPDISLSLGTDGALLRTVGETRLVDPALGCDGYTQPATPGSARSCDQFDLNGDSVVWLDNAASDQYELLVRDPSAEAGDQWRVALGMAADGGAAPKRIDVTGDGAPDLVLARRTGNDTLQLDVVEVGGGNARVVLHLDLPQGRARERSGALVVWFGFGVDGRLAQTTLDGSGGSWQSSDITVVDRGSVGSSQF